MTPDEAVERVARAIWDAPQDKAYPNQADAYALKMRMSWDEARRAAEAAIAALARPKVGDGEETKELVLTVRHGIACDAAGCSTRAFAALERLTSPTQGCGS